MVKFNQLILPGQSGGDVTAVKHAMLRMHVPDSGAMGKTDHAGPAFVRCVRHVQHSHNIKSDGIYGEQTHKYVAPHFSARDAFLYRTAKKRSTPIPPLPPGDAAENAKKLLKYHQAGKYHPDNSGDMKQIELTADGKPVWSPIGHYVHIDARVMQVLVWLIEQKFEIGTFALCSDHGYDSPNGHSGGRAVDISSINHVSVASGTSAAHELVLRVMTLLNKHTPAHLKPWQLICDGYGNMHSSDISVLTIPNAAFYGPVTMSEHRNHIHYGI